MVKLTMKLVKNSSCPLMELPGAEDRAELNKALSVETNSVLEDVEEQKLADCLLQARFA